MEREEKHHLQFAGVSALMGHDHLLQSRVEPDIPYKFVSGTFASVYTIYHCCGAYREWCDDVQNWVTEPSPPAAMGSNDGFAWQLCPQSHARVDAGGQYPALA